MRARLFVALLSLSLAACSAENAPPETASADSPDADHRIAMSEMRYEPGEIEIAAGQSVQIDLVNMGSLRHNLVLPDGFESPTLNAGESTVTQIGPLDEAVTAWCSIPGHRDAGMELEIRID